MRLTSVLELKRGGAMWFLASSVTALVTALGCAPAPATPATRGPKTQTEPSPTQATADSTPLPPDVNGSAAPAAPPKDLGGAKAGPSDAAEPSVGWIGISMKQSDAGVLVAGVLRNSPAALAGLTSGDRLLRINGQSVGTPADVGDLVQALAPGSRVTFDVRRNDATRLLYGTVEAKPDREVLLRRELVGHPAPALSELRTVQGAVVPSWSQLQGHVVVLEFWASWCMACRALAPTLNDWHDEFSALGVHILGITMDPFEEAVRASEPLNFPTYSDEDGQVTMRYQGTALPTLVLVDQQGVVVDVMVGLNFEQLPKLKKHVAALAGSAR